MEQQILDFDRYVYHVENAISRCDAEALVGFWYQSNYIYSRDETQQVHTLIEEAIPALVKKHSIPYEGQSFRDFVIIYDKIILDRECPPGCPDACFCYFARKASWKGIQRLIERGFEPNWASLVRVATASKQKVFIQTYLMPEFLKKHTLEETEYISPLRKHVSHLKRFLMRACESGDQETVEYFFELGAKVGRNALQVASEYGRLALFQFLLEKLRDSKVTEEKIKRTLHFCLFRAAYGNRKETIDYIIEQGVDDLRRGLNGAAVRCHLDLITFFINLGANSQENINEGLLYAAKGGRISAIKFLLEKGATNVEGAIETAIIIGRLSALKFLLTLIPQDERRLVLQASLVRARPDQIPESERTIEYVQSLLNSSI